MTGQAGAARAGRLPSRGRGRRCGCRCAGRARRGGLIWSSAGSGPVPPARWSARAAIPAKVPNSGPRDAAGWRVMAYLLAKLPVGLIELCAVFFWIGGPVNLSYPLWWGRSATTRRGFG